MVPLLSSWAPVILWAGLIYHLSSIPHLTTGWGIWDLILRKIAHVAEYAILMVLLLRAFWRTWPMGRRGAVLAWCFGLAVFYAATDEFHQSFVPGRGPSVIDVLIDAFGAAAASWVYRNTSEFAA